MVDNKEESPRLISNSNSSSAFDFYELNKNVLNEDNELEHDQEHDKNDVYVLIKFLGQGSFYS
jgi:hypothetical protein